MSARDFFKNEVNRIISKQDLFCFHSVFDDREYAASFTVKKFLLVRKSAVNSALLLQISSLHTEQ